MNKVEMEKDVFITEIKRIPMFREMTDEGLSAIADFADVLAYETDEKIITENTKNKIFYILMTGKVEIVKIAKSSDVVRLAVLKAPSYFGESSLFEDELTTATVRCLEPALIVGFSREQFSNFMYNHPKAGNIMLTYIIFGLLQKLKSTNDELVEEKNLDFSERDLEVLSSLFSPEKI